jgi:hypothetical protein
LAPIYSCFNYRLLIVMALHHSAHLLEQTSLCAAPTQQHTA